MKKNRETLAGIVRFTLPSYPMADDSRREVVENDVTEWVSAQLCSMPAFMQLPLSIALWAFEWLPLVRFGSPFQSLPHATQGSYLAWWASGPLVRMRDFVKLIRSLALFSYFDHPFVSRRLHEEQSAARVSKSGVDS